MTSLPKPPKRRRSAAKKTAWRNFSLYIRLRDSDLNGIARCCTCGTPHHYREGDAGHFVSGRRDAILFDERGSHFQCRKCNRFLQGRWPEYFEFMLKKYGRAVIDDLLARNKDFANYTDEDFRRIAKEYREKAKELQK